MSKQKENLCDALVQQIASTAKSQWSNYPAECGHHNIRRASILWRWRLVNIVALTIEEHGMLHAGLLDPLHEWQKRFFSKHRNDLLEKELQKKGMIRDEFVEIAYNYLKEVKRDIDRGETTFEDVVKEERKCYEID